MIRGEQAVDQLHTLFPYMIGINIVTFILMGVDKQRARNRAWRIPERTFWILAIIGGSIGSFVGMRVFHHKTKHLTFTIGMPLLIGIHFLLFLYLFAYMS